jgi:hypothetical protein
VNSTTEFPLKITTPSVVGVASGDSANTAEMVRNKKAARVRVYFSGIGKENGIFRLVLLEINRGFAGEKNIERVSLPSD